MKYNLNFDKIPLSFGKYKGKTPEEICKEDPAYIEWMERKFRFDYFSRDLWKDALSMLEDEDDLYDDLDLY